MSNLRDLSKRIDSITSTKQITRTMEMVSTARVGEALRKATDAAPYRDAIARMLANVADADPRGADQPLLRRPDEVGGALHIVIASDRGLAGGFNMSVQRAAEAEIREMVSKGKRAEVITCGSKPTDYFRYRGIEPALSFKGLSAEPTHEQSLQIASYAIDGFVKGEFDEVVLHYNHAKNRVQQEVIRNVLLPVGAEGLSVPDKPRHGEGMQELTAPAVTEFAFDPSPEEVLGYLMPAYIQTVVFHSLLDSAAAEHGARRRAMKSATDNAEEAITKLNRMYNRIRQGSITTELNEIIGGASALEDN